MISINSDIAKALIASRLKGEKFDKSVTRGEPQPFSHFYPSYEEEFDL